MQKLILFIMGLVCAASIVRAQSRAEIKPLHIGDTVPDIIFSHMLNYNATTARLSDFAGKPVILDFFATWCGACLEALPRLDSLQKQFKDRIQIIVVTRETSREITAFLHHHPNIHYMTLPFITGDSLLNICFPHSMIPHEVWINRKEKVAAITQYYYVTAANIQKLLTGSPINLPVKKDIMDFAVEHTLAEDYSILKQPAFSSTFGKFIKGAPAMSLTNKNNKRVRFFATNATILSLYKSAVPRLNNRIILQVKDSSRFFREQNKPFDRWAAKNCFCYEITAPPDVTQEKLHQYMIQDLNCYLALDGHKEERMVRCWALVPIRRNTVSFKGQGDKPEIDYGEQRPVQAFKNIPIKEFITAINYQTPGTSPSPIVINETHYNGLVNLELKVDNIHDVPAMRQALRSYGLDLVPVRRKLEMFVISGESGNTAIPKSSKYKK